MQPEPQRTVNEFGGGRADTVVQAGNVYGGIHFAPADPAFPAPHQLPLRPAGFVNRRADLATLNGLLPPEACRGAARLTTITGAPGVGKTALALAWAYGVRARFPDGDLYVDLQGYGPGPALTPLQVLDLFLRALGSPADRIPETLAGRSALFRSLLAGRRVLVVIDNAAGSAQVRPLIPAGDGCFTVVTSRSALPGLVTREGAARVTLDVLTPEESVALLSRLAGADGPRADPAAALRLAELCGHLPIALRIVAERASARPHSTLAELVEELEDEQDRLDALASAEDELSDTRVVFSWSYHNLDDDLRRSFRRLALHTGPDLGAEAAAALLGGSVTRTRRHLRALAEVSLLQEVFPHRFRMHDLLHAYALERAVAEDSREQRTWAVRRLLTWYLLVTDECRRSVLPHSADVPLVPRLGLHVRGEFADSTEAWDWFGAERPNVLAALRRAEEFGQLDLVWKLALAASGPLELHSCWPDWETTARAGVTAAHTLGDAYGEAAGLLILGDARARIDRLDEAAEHYQEAATLARAIPVPWIEGFAERGIGLLHESRNAPDAALPHFEAAFRIFRDVGHRRGEGMSLLSIAATHRARHDPGRATDHGTRALRILADLDDPWTLAWGRLEQARNLAESGRESEAEAELRTALAVFRDHGDRHSEALALTVLGDVCRRTGRVEEAREHRAAAAGFLDGTGGAESAELRARLAESEPDPEA